MNNDDYGLTPEEWELCNEITRIRIAAIEAKRLAMTDEERELLRLWQRVKGDPELREFLTTLVILGAGKGN